MDTQVMKGGNKTSPQSNLGSFLSGLFAAGVLTGISLFLVPLLLFGVAIVLKDSVGYIPLRPLQLVVGVLLYPFISALPVVQILLFLGFAIMVVRKARWKGSYFLMGFLLLAIPILIFATTVAVSDTLFYCYAGPIGFYEGLGGGGICPPEDARVWWRMGLAQ